MRNLKAQELNRKASDPKNKPDEIIKELELRPSLYVADIGCGGGYFTIRFAEIVGKSGRVYAVDSNPKFLNYVKNTANEKGLGNIITVLVSGIGIDIPENSIDLIFMRNVTHHIKNRIEYFKNLKPILKPDGKIAIIDYRKGPIFSLHGLFRHYVDKEIIINEMNKAGYKLEKDCDFLSEQHFTIYKSK